MSPKLACLDCGIPTIRSRCDKCFMKKQETNPRFRAKTAARGYDSKWQRIRIQILNRDHWRCRYCDKVLEGKDATVDHVIALSKGGSQYDPNNLIASCRGCNSSKRDK